jgi:hypothetical protein
MQPNSFSVKVHTLLYIEVGRARAKARLYYLFRKAQPREQLKPDLFSDVFQPANTQARSMAPVHGPTPKNLARPTSTLYSGKKLSKKREPLL